MIRLPDYGETAYAEGERLQEGVRLVEILPYGVVLERGGVRERLMLGEESEMALRRAQEREAAARGRTTDRPAETSTAARQAGEPDMAASLARQRYGDLDLSDPLMLMADLGLAQARTDGGQPGFVIQGRADPQVLEALDLRVGDIITHIEGIALTGPEAVQDLQARLRATSSVQLRLQRNGRSETITVDVEQ
jgi:type II secretory pathway component PulC